MHHFFGYLMIVLVATVMMTLKGYDPYMKIEHFQSNEQGDIPLEAKPSEIYFTSDVKRCDFPSAFDFTTDNTIAHRKVDYTWNVKWYQKLYEYLRAVYGITYDGASPTPTQNATLLELQYIIDQYKNFPGPHKVGTCKVALPNWYTFMPYRTDIKTSERILLGNIEQNSARGPPNSWAFIGHANPSIQTLAENGLEFELDPVKDDWWKLSTYDGKQYYRAAISEFSENMVTRTYCEEGEGYNQSSIALGFQIDPETKKVTFIKQSRPVEITDITDYDILTFFKPFFTDEQITNKGNKEYLSKISTTRAYKVTKLSKNLCDTISKSYTDIDVIIGFNDESTIKSIITSVADGVYFKGKTSDVAKMTADVTARFEQVKVDLATTKKNYDDAVTELASTEASLARYRDAYNATLGNLNAFKRIKGKWWFKTWTTNTRNNVENKINELQSQLRDNEKQHRSNWTNRNSARTKVNTTKNLYDQKKEEYNNTKRILDDLQYYSKYMNETLMKDIRTMLINNKLQVNTDADQTDYPPPYFNKKTYTTVYHPRHYWKHLSYDGNLYVVL
jgi:hypothetical protein